MKFGLAAALVLLLVGAMAWLLTGAPAVHAPLTPSVASSATATALPTSAATQKSAPKGAAQIAANASLTPEAGLDKAAILSMREARENGDSRAPPMSPPTRERDKPTADELADPKLYAGYEQQQTLKAYQLYVDAVPKKVAKLQAALDEAAQPGSGITPEQQAFARQKIADLEAMKTKLLAEHPQLKAPSYQSSAKSSPSPQPSP